MNIRTPFTDFASRQLTNRIWGSRKVSDQYLPSLCVTDRVPFQQKSSNVAVYGTITSTANIVASQLCSTCASRVKLAGSLVTAIEALRLEFYDDSVEYGEPQGRVAHAESGGS
jgi:hypothetical protein